MVNVIIYFFTLLKYKKGKTYFNKKKNNTHTHTHTHIYIYTTPLISFTDGLIPLVTGMNSVGEIITDGLTDGTRPSV
jgi:hypothetical protein